MDVDGTILAVSFLCVSYMYEVIFHVVTKRMHLEWDVRSRQEPHTSNLASNGLPVAHICQRQITKTILKHFWAGQAAFGSLFKVEIKFDLRLKFCDFCHTNLHIVKTSFKI